LAQQQQQQQQQQEEEDEPSAPGRPPLAQQQQQQEEDVPSAPGTARTKPTLSGVNLINTSLAFLVLRLILEFETLPTLALCEGLSDASSLPASHIAYSLVAADALQLLAVALILRIAAPHGPQKAALTQEQEQRSLGTTFWAGVCGGVVSCLALSALSSVLPQQDAASTEVGIEILPWQSRA
jgi:high-affinity Fe2+/Pb2+ permease